MKTFLSTVGVLLFVLFLFAPYIFGQVGVVSGGTQTSTYTVTNAPDNIFLMESAGLLTIKPDATPPGVLATGGVVPALAWVLIDSTHIQNYGIGKTDIDTNAVTAVQIAANAVGASEIAANSIALSEMGDNSVGSTEIINYSIATADIDTDAVTAVHIAANAVGSSEVGTSAIGTGEIQNASILSEDIQDLAIVAAKIDTGAVTSVGILNNTVANVDIVNDSWTLFSMNGIEIQDGTGAYHRNGDDWTVSIGDQLAYKAYVDSLTIGFTAGGALQVDSVFRAVLDTALVETYLYPPYPNGYGDYLENVLLDSFSVVDTMDWSAGTRYATYRRITSNNTEAGLMQIYHLIIMWSPTAPWRAWPAHGNVLSLEYRTSTETDSLYYLQIKIRDEDGTAIHTETSGESESAAVWSTMGITGAEIGTITNYPMSIDIEVGVSSKADDSDITFDLGYLYIKYNTR